jgi:hypothetical protein
MNLAPVNSNRARNFNAVLETSGKIEHAFRELAPNSGSQSVIVRLV